MIEAHQRLGGLQYSLGNISEARNHYQQCLSLARDLWQRKPEDPIHRQLVAMSYGQLEISSLTAWKHSTF